MIDLAMFRSFKISQKTVQVRAKGENTQMCRFRFIAALLVQLSLISISMVAAQAAPINFAASDSKITSFDADLPLRSIGGLALPKGSVTLAGSTIEVNAVPDWLFDKQAVLSGVVINPHLKTTGSEASLTGLAYFSRGEWLDNLGGKIRSEVVTTSNGTALTGRIDGATDKGLEIHLLDGSRRSIPLAQIENISSVRAFTFAIPAKSVRLEPSSSSYQAESNTISFRPSTFASNVRFIASKPKVPQSNLPGTQGGVSNSRIAAMVVADAINMIAPAIVAPIIFRGPSLADQQLLHGNGNVGDSQPYYAPQVWKNGQYVPYPFTNNYQTNVLIEQIGLQSGNPLF